MVDRVRHMDPTAFRLIDERRTLLQSALTTTACSLSVQFGETPLHAAAAKGHVACVEVLLSRGVQPDMPGHVRAQLLPPPNHHC